MLMTATECVQDGLVAGRIYLKYDSRILWSTRGSNTIQIARVVGDKVKFGICTIGSVSKRVQNAITVRIREALAQALSRLRRRDCR